MGRGRSWESLYLLLSYNIRDLVDEKEIPNNPKEFKLKQNYPNPFSLLSGYATTTIRFLIMSQQHITVTIYDILGREIKVLLSKVMSPGSYSVTWDGRDSSSGLDVPTGVYFYELRYPDFTARRKMLVIH